MQYEFDRVSIRMVKDPPLLSDKPIQGPGDAIDLVNEFLHDFDRELMIVVNLKNDGTPINMNIMSMGTVNGALSNPREAVKPSILSNAAKVILFHNHPSGTLKPSQEDTIIESYKTNGFYRWVIYYTKRKVYFIFNMGKDGSWFSDNAIAHKAPQFCKPLNRACLTTGYLAPALGLAKANSQLPIVTVSEYLSYR